MFYFKHFLEQEYTFSITTNNGLVKTYPLKLSDIFRRVKFTEKTKNDEDNFDYFIISRDQSPTQISSLAYDDVNLWWIILLFNDIIDPINEWVLSQSELDNKFNSLYLGDVYFFTERLDVVPGDLLVKRDISQTPAIDINNYCIIHEYDPMLRKTTTKTIKGELSELDEVYVFRKFSGSYMSLTGGFGYTGCYPAYSGSTFCNDISGPLSSPSDLPWMAPLCGTAGSTFGIIRRKDTIIDSVSSFVFDNEQINPYSGIVNGAPEGDFYTIDNICGLTSSVLYRYITKNLPTSVLIKTEREKIINDNDNRRKIKIPKIEVIPKILEQISRLFLKETIIDEEFIVEV